MINIKNFNLSFGQNHIFANFNFHVEKGQIVGIYGPTGSGKTSLLNKIVEDYISKYKISYVFQDNKLLENLSVEKNILIPIEKLFSKGDARGRALESLKLFQLEHKSEEKVSVLSGGEKQRCNLGRAFAYPCEIMLLDEPFSAQDDGQRERLLSLCKDFLKEKGITSIVVSHNIKELEKLCDKIVKIGTSN